MNLNLYTQRQYFFPWEDSKVGIENSQGDVAMLIYEFSIPAPESSHGKKITVNFTLSTPQKGNMGP